MDNVIRKKRYKLNTIFGLSQTIVSMICGLILPRLILSTYGSSVNGLINSITNLLGFISLFDMGIGATVQAALYKPIADNNQNQINKVYSYARKFYRFISLILFIYVIVLCVILPIKFNSQYEPIFTILLIIALSLTSLGTYYFGNVNSILLRAEQQGYIYFSLQIITTILNTILCFIEVKLGLSIQLVKITTSIIYLLRPIGMYLYIKYKYKDIKIVSTKGENVLPEKWGGFTQHIAAYILGQTDILLLTFFATLEDVSIYSVYYLITNTAIYKLLDGLLAGDTPLLGSYLAQGDLEQTKKFYYKKEFIIHTISTIVYSVTACLLVPFIKLYTRNVTDANYNQPLFAILMVIQSICWLLRSFYYELLYAKGEFKKTQWVALLEALINVIVSLIFVNWLGLIGVAIGTIVSLIYRIICFLFYNYKILGKKVILSFLKNIIIDMLIFLSIVGMYQFVKFDAANYFMWVLSGIMMLGIALGVSIVVNVILNYNNVKKICISLILKLKR